MVTVTPYLISWGGMGRRGEEEMLQTKKIVLFIHRCYFNWLGGIIVKCVTYLHGIYRQPLLPVLYSLQPRARRVIRQNCVRPGNKSAGSNSDTQCSCQAKACKVMKEKNCTITTIITPSVLGTISC